MGRRKKGGIPGLSFSWKRATGVTSAKRKFTKVTGIPTTKAGRKNKLRRMITGGGCIVPVVLAISIVLGIVAILIQ